MPQISTEEFEGLPLRVHDFLAGVPLHDVWAVDLPRTRTGITIDEFLKAGKTHQCSLSPNTRARCACVFPSGDECDPNPKTVTSHVTRILATIF